MNSPTIFTENNLKESTLIKLLPLFISEVKKDFKKLQADYSNHNLEGIKNVVHKIKGTSKSYGAKLIIDAAYDLERSAMENKPFDEIYSKVNFLESQIKQTVQFAKFKYGVEVAN